MGMANSRHGETKEQAAELAAERSGVLFEAGYYCAESVLLAMAEQSGLQSDLLPRIASGFCSGMARTKRTCGAISGAVMGLGMLNGRESPEVSEEDLYARVQELIRTFEDRFGSTDCWQLIRCDLNTEQGQRDFEERGLAEQCKQYTREATRIAMLLIGD